MKRRTSIHTYILVFLVLLLALLSQACALLTEQEREEIEWQHAMDRENWRICEMAYQQAGIPMQSSHDHRRGRPHRIEDVRADLRDNQCRVLLKRAGLWAE